MAFTQDILQKGWSIVDLKGNDIISDIQKLLLKRLNEKWSRTLVNLIEYHDHISDKLHTDVQIDLSGYLNSSDLVRKLVGSNLSFIQTLCGIDVHVQNVPYLRIARPGERKDNIGFHRDTYYGCSPFEISMHIPLVELPKQAAIGVISGSHIAAEGDFKWRQHRDPEVTKGSKKHKIGFLYAPKVMAGSVVEKMEFYPINLGQAMFFPLSLVHGQEVNRSKITRFSIDIRFVNSYAPILWQRNVTENYYIPLSSSVISEVATIYKKNNIDH